MKVIAAVLVSLVLTTLPGKPMIFSSDDILVLTGVESEQMSLFDPLVNAVGAGAENVDVLALEGFTYAADTAEELLTALYLQEPGSIEGINWSEISSRFAGDPDGADKICYMWLIKGIRLDKRSEYITLVTNKVYPLLKDKMVSGLYSRELLKRKFNDYVTDAIPALFNGHSFASLDGETVLAETVFASYPGEKEVLLKSLTGFYTLGDYRPTVEAKEKLGIVLGYLRQKFSGQNQWFGIESFYYKYLGRSFLDSKNMVSSFSRGQQLYIREGDKGLDSLR